MLLYNIIAEIAADQFVIIALYEVITIGIIFLVFKKRLTLKACLITVFMALILSLISTIIARGYYGGTLYHEKLGWPIQYYYVIRSIEIGTNIASPYSFNFVFSKFFANTFIWLYLPIAAFSIYLDKKRNRAFVIYVVIIIIIYTCLVAGFSLFNLSYR